MPKTIKQRVNDKRRPDQMRPELKEQCDRIRELLANNERDTVLARYQVGAIVAKVKSEDATYGTAAVDQLAKALGLDSTTLYDFAKVADEWEESGIEDLMGRTGARGLPLTWSHLVELVRVTDRTSRQQLIQEVLKEQMTVRVLRERISTLSNGRAPDETVSPEAVMEPAPSVARQTSEGKEPAQGLSELTAGISPVLQSEPKLPSDIVNGIRELSTGTDNRTNWLRQRAETIRRVLDMKPEAAVSQLNQLRDAETSVQRHRTSCDELLEELRACIRHVQSARGAPPHGRVEAGRPGPVE
jgi:hypothetical protein